MRLRRLTLNTSVSGPSTKNSSGESILGSMELEAVRYEFNVDTSPFSLTPSLSIPSF